VTSEGEILRTEPQQASWAPLLRSNEQSERQSNGAVHEQQPCTQGLIWNKERIQKLAFECDLYSKSTPFILRGSRFYSDFL